MRSVRLEPQKDLGFQLKKNLRLGFEKSSGWAASDFKVDFQKTDALELKVYDRFTLLMSWSSKLKTVSHALRPWNSKLMTVSFSNLWSSLQLECEDVASIMWRERGRTRSPRNYVSIGTNRDS